ncbi:MAG: flagellar hook-associated protein 3 FlgL [Solirubrobacteraceae bacterium]|jgi:flagellar hook-associated protein 3 FlgL|nr:flagellar hook-associated protein 3 FlgL [Solirubrobacteraceae bacterium]
MRITEGIVAGRSLADLQRANSAVARTSQQVSTGNQILRPSDDPLGTQKALNLRAELAATDQYIANANGSLGWAQATDDALGDINDVLQTARELLVQGGNDVMSSKDRADLANQIDHLIGQAKASGNATFDGQYIFAGTATDTAPYDADGADAYSGDGGAIIRTIGPGVSVRLNATAGSVLGNGSDGKALQVLRDIATHLRGGTATDANALRSTDLAAIDASMADLNSARAEAGALSNRLTAAANRLTDLQVSTEKVRSGIEYVDLAEALSTLANQQSIYQAALQATGSSLSQRTLMDFLG